MKLLLTSQGFTTEPIIFAFEELCGKPRDEISVAIINEAYAVGVGGKRWVIDELGNVGEVCGGEIEIVNLYALKGDDRAERFARVDAIFVLGGNTDYLMHVFNESGFSKELSELLKSKVYVGSSAGSMVMCRRVSTAAYAEIYEEKLDFGTTDYLELAPFALKPHLGSPNFPNNRTDILKRVGEDFDGEIIGLRDDQAIVVTDSGVEFIGGTPFSTRAPT